MGSVFSCFIVSRHSRGWWERHRRAFLRFLPPTASTKWSGAFRETWGLFFCFTLSSRLFPALLILLVRLYLRHNDLIATTCLPNRKKKLHSGGLTSSFFFFFGGKLLFKCNIAFENDSHLWPCEGFRSSRSCSHNFHLIIADQRRWGLIRLEDQQLTGGITQSRSVSLTDFCLWGKKTNSTFWSNFYPAPKKGWKKTNPSSPCFHTDQKACVLRFTQKSPGLFSSSISLFSSWDGSSGSQWGHSRASTTAWPPSSPSPPTACGETSSSGNFTVVCCFFFCCFVSRPPSLVMIFSAWQWRGKTGNVKVETLIGADFFWVVIWCKPPAQRAVDTVYRCGPSSHRITPDQVLRGESKKKKKGSHLT